MLSLEDDRICSSSVWDETYNSWDNSCFDSICLLSIKSYKYIFPLEENVSRVTELKNTLTMLSVEVERIRSSSVWDETSFYWNKKTINEMIVILSKTSTFFYWTRTCHVSENLKNTFTLLSSEVDRICSSSVWEETSFCWKNKTGNKMIIILLKRSIFSYWTRTCHVSQNGKIP